MKSVFRMLFMAGLVSVLFVNCAKEDEEKDEDVIEEHFNENFFVIENGDFVADYMPEPSSSSSAPELDEVTGNSNVLAGGGNLLSVQSTSDIEELLVAVVGEEGHYVIDAGRAEASNGMYLVSLLISQEAEEDFSIAIAAANSSNQVSLYSKVDVTVIEAGTGQLQVNCTWNKQNDVDLYLLEPNGEEISYSNSYSDNGGWLDVDSNSACNIDNKNSENITYSEEATVESGEYEVGVDLWSNCDVSGPTSYIVTVYYGNALINPSTGSNPYYGTFYGDEDEIVSVMKFDIGSRKNADIAIEKMFTFKYPNSGKERVKNISPMKE